MKFTVHSFHARMVPVRAKTAAGTEVEAAMTGAEVELVPEDGGKTVTLLLHEENYSGLPMADMFAVGKEVALGFTLVKAAKAGESK